MDQTRGSNKDFREAVLNGLRDAENFEYSPVETIRDEFLEFERNALQRVLFKCQELTDEHAAFKIIKLVQEELEK